MKFSMAKLITLVTWLCCLFGFIAMLSPHEMDWELFWSGWHGGELGKYTDSYKFGGLVGLGVKITWGVGLLFSAIVMFVCWVLPDLPASDDEDDDDDDDE